MKSTRAQAAANKEHVLQLGSQRFRECGYDGIGVADLMREAGQTHGAFYGNFASKEDFIAQASAKGFEQMFRNWLDAGSALSETSGASLLQSLVTVYLSEAHRDNPGQGCLAVALGADASRQGPVVRSAMTEGIQEILKLLASHAPDTAEGQRREHAVLVFSSLVGALTIARAVNDEALSSEIMATTARRLVSVLTKSTPAKAAR